MLRLLILAAKDKLFIGVLHPHAWCCEALFLQVGSGFGFGLGLGLGAGLVIVKRTFSPPISSPHLAIGIGLAGFVVHSMAKLLWAVLYGDLINQVDIGLPRVVSAL